MMRALALLAIGALAGCAYYNAMWSAERFAKDARRLEERGQEPEARQLWARAAAKAESVIVHHPRSRWADDALVLQAEGLSRAGTCAAARAPIAKARSSVSEPALRERAALAAAQCALAAQQPAQAEAALTDVLGSQDATRRSRAELLAGQAAAARLDYDSAVAHFRRSREPAALPARARALLAAHQSAAAAAVIDTLAGARLHDTERAELLAELANVGGVELAGAALDRQLAGTRLPFVEQARLLIADGDRRLAQGDRDAAEARYRQVVAIAPVATPEAGIAGVRVQRVTLSRAARRSDLAPVIEELSRLSRTEGASASGAQHLLDLVNAATAAPETPGARLHAAELARDSLGAPALAGQLFLDAAAADSASLYAPKALLAALPLLPDRHDSIAAVLDERYGASPYTRAYHGEVSVAYAAAEDSLARELGLQVAALPPAAAAVGGGGGRFAAPYPGPRGPQLDEPVRVLAPPTRTPARTPRSATERPTRDRPAQPQRPPP